MAAVVASGEVTAKELRAHCAGFLAGFKVPERVHFLEDLPRSVTGSAEAEGPGGPRVSAPPPALAGPGLPASDVLAAGPRLPTCVDSCERKRTDETWFA